MNDLILLVNQINLKRAVKLILSRKKFLDELIKTFCLLTLFSSSLVCSQQPGIYKFETALKSNMYLDVKWANTQNGTPLHLWPGNNGKAQKFILENAGEGYLYIKSALGKYLHVQNRSNKPRALVLIWSGKGNDNTKWKFIKAGNGYYYLKSKKGTFLDVQWASTKPGTPIWMWSYNGGNAQKWKLIDLNNPTSNYPSKKVSGRVVRGKAQYNTQEKILKEDYDDESLQQYCTFKQISVDESSQEDIGFLITSGDASEVYPGAIYKSNAFTEGTYARPNLKYQDYKITIDLVSSSSGNTGKKVQADDQGNVYKSDVYNAMSDLIKVNQSVINPASFTYTIHKIEDQRDLDVMAYGEFNGFGASLKAEFNYSRKTKKNLYVVRFHQKYYTISLDRQNIVDVNKSQDQVKNDDVYISEVTYGRAGFLKIDSDYDEETIRGAVEAAYKNINYNLKLKGGVTLRQVANDWRFTAYAVGGDNQTFINLEGFNRWVKISNWRPEIAQVPIGYKLSFINNHQIADVRVTAKYTKRECRPYTATRVTFLGIEISNGWHNDDCTRIGHDIYISMAKVDNKGNIEEYYNGFKQDRSVSTRPILSQWSQHEGYHRGRKIFIKRPKEIIRGGTINVDNPKSVPTYVEFKVDQKAYENNQVILILEHKLNSCHKWGDFSTDFNCGIRTKNGKFIVTKRLKSDLLSNNGLEGKVFNSGNIPTENNDRWNHKWKVWYKVKQF
ncbi:RICIN domain-containing protein [Aquimarina celericrescens]|uniref:RICIN domain-containing protein n=1 Tax=Aquimarina celericrescens TaxID=1964542 RepID=A0ABW5ATW8_9FLAO|nr:RICIN domain-containing protein [Aquimarina celericrescens]